MIATVANEDFRALYQVEDISLYASLVRLQPSPVILRISGSGLGV